VCVYLFYNYLTVKWNRSNSRKRFAAEDRCYSHASPGVSFTIAFLALAFPAPDALEGLKALVYLDVVFEI
jgi:hypothetical protein